MGTNATPTGARGEWVESQGHQGLVVSDYVEAPDQDERMVAFFGGVPAHFEGFVYDGLPGSDTLVVLPAAKLLGEFGLAQPLSMNGPTRR